MGFMVALRLGRGEYQTQFPS